MGRRSVIKLRDRGFSLIELIAVIGVIAILVALLLPAVQYARSSARTMHCRNNMKQVALAMHEYHEAHDTLPPGMFNYLGDDIDQVIQWDGTVGLKGPARTCWMQQLLPYLEQGELYELLPFESNVAARTWGRDLNVPIWTAIPPLMCPMDPANPKVITDKATGAEDSEGFHGNIVMCAGNTEFGLADQGEVTGEGAGDDLNGMFYALSRMRMGDVHDGLSNTVMGSEIVLTRDVQGADNFESGGTGLRDVRGRYYNSYRGNALFSTQFPPNTSVPDEFRYCQIPNPFAPCNSGADVIVQYDRSYHPDGANVMLADGSVRFFSEFTSLDVFRTLGSRADGEDVSDF